MGVKWASDLISIEKLLIDIYMYGLWIRDYK